MSSLRDSTHKKVRQKNRSVENVLITGLLLLLASLIRPFPLHQRAAQPPPHHQRERLSRDFKTKKSGRKLDREEKDWRRRRRLKKKSLPSESRRTTYIFGGRARYWLIIRGQLDHVFPSFQIPNLGPGSPTDVEAGKGQKHRHGRRG